MRILSGVIRCSFPYEINKGVSGELSIFPAQSCFFIAVPGYCVIEEDTVGRSGLHDSKSWRCLLCWVERFLAHYSVNHANQGLVVLRLLHHVYFIEKKAAHLLVHQLTCVITAIRT